MTVAVIDSGVANLESVMSAMRRLHADAVTTDDATIIAKASHVILPGVGAAAPAMTKLRQKNLVDVIRGLGQPVLGICLGMQLLFERMNESGGVEGLGLIRGTVSQLPGTPEQPVPHMGWNTITFKHPSHRLLNNIANESFVYFVHSFAADVSTATIAATSYGKEFTSIVGNRNFFGCQFHPERSSSVGSQILKNFLSC